MQYPYQYQPDPPRFPEPDAIGSELASRLREQVLASSRAEAERTPVRIAPCPGLVTHRRLVALTRRAL